MLFLVSFGWHVAASFAFLLAILSPNWIAVQMLPASRNVQLQRGIFFVCDFIGRDVTYEWTQCASIIGVNQSYNSTSRWNYSEWISRTSAARCRE